ncbi:MAG: hypothetical protein V4864_13420 [Pseudomonadota bacterium]
MSAPDETHSDEEYRMPRVEALLAGTLALMTGHAQCDCRAGHREAMEHKIGENLTELAGHPLLSPDFRAVLRSLRVRWERMRDAGAPRTAQQDPRLWHAQPESIQ